LGVPADVSGAHDGDFHNELARRLAGTLSEDEAERLDAEASATLAAALARIKD
jgi:hypothetical protein